MAAPVKPLAEMSSDEIAALPPEAFKELAADHNDQVERNETLYQRAIDHAKTLTDGELHDKRLSLEIKRGVDSDFQHQGLYAADPFDVGHQRTLDAITDEQVKRYRENEAIADALPGNAKAWAEIGRTLAEPDFRGADNRPAETLITKPIQLTESYLDRLERQQREKGQTLADLLPQEQRDQQRQQEQDRGHGLEHDL